MFKNRPILHRILIGVGLFLLAALISFGLAKGLGFLLAHIFDADISKQVYQIVVLLAFGGLASIYFFSFKIVRKHIRQFGLQYPGGGYGMELLHMFQGVIIIVIIAWIGYTIYGNFKEILEMVSS